METITDFPVLHTWAPHVTPEQKERLNKNCPLIAPGIRLIDGVMACDELEICYENYDEDSGKWYTAYYFLESY
jgi:hypothetical protein